MGEERKLGTGTFSGFRITNRSDDTGGEQAGVVPSEGPEDPGYPAKVGANSVIMNGETGTASIPGGIPAPTVIYLWGMEMSEGANHWKRWQLNFDGEVEDLYVIAKGTAEQWGGAGMLEVSVAGPGNPSLQGLPVDAPSGNEPPWV